MTAFILKSSMSLFFLYGLYWFLLRNEKCFIFNRYFLIFSIVFSLIVPFVTIQVDFVSPQNMDRVITILDYINPEVIPATNTSSEIVTQFIDTGNSSSPWISIADILLILYIAGVIIFLIRFLANIHTILREIKSSEKIKYPGYWIVFSKGQTSPHCFFNTIFLKKQDHPTEIIDEDLLSHELGHIRGWHSLDILFIEIIRSFYWFNPVFLLYRKAIKTNHEYLTDNSVIREHKDLDGYVNRLVSFIDDKESTPLTSGFSHSLTMKRLRMMTRSNSQGILSRIKPIVILCFILLYFIVLSCKQSVNSSEPVTLGDSVVLSEDEHLQQQEISELDSLIEWSITKSEQDSMIEAWGRNISIHATNVENEMWRWEPILRKHNIDLNEFNYKYTFETIFQDTLRGHYLELGTINTIPDQYVFLRNAILISKSDQREVYNMATARTLYHDHGQEVYEIMDYTWIPFSSTSAAVEPLHEEFIGTQSISYLKLGLSISGKSRIYFIP